MSRESLRRGLTIDRGPPGGGPPLGGTASAPLEVGSIGPNRSLLPDGSLLCRCVPIARTGWMNYSPGEVPLDPATTAGAAPIIYVNRRPEDLFNDETMRSFVGVAITHDHPPVPVTPANFAHFCKGFVLNTYRGEGADGDCLMADIIIKDKWAIDHYHLASPGQVNCEVSCGYEATYVQTGDGQGKQTHIIGNHLALVAKGRCGPRCAIGDEDTLSPTDVNEETMTQQANPGAKSPRIPLAELRAKVADTLGLLDQHAEQEAQNGVHVHVHMGGQPREPLADGATPPPEVKTPVVDPATEARLATMEKGQEELKGTLATILAAVQAGGAQAAKTPPAGGEDPEIVTEATATMDSAPLSNSYQQFLSQAEILVPGFRLPTFDAMAQRKLTVDRMCQGRRLVLGALQSQAGGVELLTAANGGKEFDVIGATCPDVAVAFKAAAAAKASANNRSATGDAGTLPKNQQGQAPKRQNFADLNKVNADFWKTQGPRA